MKKLDKETKMSDVKLKEEKQKKIKTLSNAVSLIGKIGGIVLKVLIPFIVLAMIVTPVVIRNINVKDNSITIADGIIKIADDKIEISDIKIDDIDSKDFNETIKIFNDYSKTELIVYSETAYVFLIIEFIIAIMILKFVEKLFENIKINSTPFTMDNVGYIKKIAYYLVALIVVNSISSSIILLIGGSEYIGSHFGLMEILEILIIFSMSYIFEYGYEIQADSKGVMYDEKK